MRIKFFLVLVLAGMFYATDVQASSWQVLNKGTGLPGNNVNSLGTAKNQMAVGTDNGIGLYNGETCLWKTIALPEKVASSQIRDLAFDSKGNIWVASSNGVISIQNGSVEIFGVADGLPTLDIERIQVRKEEIFAGSFGGFVSKAFVPEAGRTSFAPVNYSRSSEDENPRICAIGITGLAMLNSSEGWVSTKGAGLIYNRGMSKDILTMENGLDSDWVEAFWVFEGQQKVEHLIAATLKGMTIFRDRKKIGTISVPVKSENSWITSVIAIYCDDYQAPRKGLNDEWDAVKFLGKRAMWVGTKNEGLFRFENGKWTNFVPENSLLPSRNINRLYFHQGRLLVCTDAGLVVIPLAANSFDEFKYIGIGSKYFKTIYPHLVITPVNHLAKRADFWIATDAGLSRFIGVSGQSADTLTDSENLSSSMEDLSPQSLESAGGRPVTLGGELKWERFYRENGSLFSNEISALSCDPFGGTWLVFEKKVFARARVKQLPKKADEVNQRKEEYLWEFFRGTQVPWVLGTELSAIWFNEGKLFIGTKGDGFYILKNPETAPNERKEIKLNWEHYGHVEGLLDVKVIGFARRAVTGREPVYALLHPDGMTFWAGKRDFKPFSFDGRREYTCITSDLEGNVWLGSNGGGVIRITADDKILQYTIGNANFGSNRITAIVSGSDPSQGKGIALWVACDNVKDGSDQVPGLRDGRTIESDIDGSTTHFYDGLAWDKWKIPGIRCFLADGSYLWGGTNIRLRRFYIPNFTDYNK